MKTENYEFDSEIGFDDGVSLKIKRFGNAHCLICFDDGELLRDNPPETIIMDNKSLYKMAALIMDFTQKDN